MFKNTKTALIIAAIATILTAAVGFAINASRPRQLTPAELSALADFKLTNSVIYLSVHGDDKNPGTKELPVCTAAMALQLVPERRELLEVDTRLTVYITHGSYDVFRVYSPGVGFQAKVDNGIEIR